MDCSSSPMWILLATSHIKSAPVLIAGVTTYKTLLSECQNHLASSFHPALADIHSASMHRQRSCNCSCALGYNIKRAASEHPLGSEISKEGMSQSTINSSVHHGNKAKPHLPPTRFSRTTSTCPTALFLRISRYGNKRVLRARG